jgi:3-deoxy-D-manno-octulosonic-acid transferase
MAAALDQAGGALTVENAESLAATVSRLLGDPHERATRAKAAARAAAESAGALEAVLDQLAPWLDPLAPNAASEFEPLPLRRVGGSADARA